MKELYDYLISIKQNQMDIALNGDTEVLVNCKNFHQWFELKITPSEKNGQRYKIIMKMNLPLPARSRPSPCSSYEVNIDTADRAALFLYAMLGRMCTRVVTLLRDDTVGEFSHRCAVAKIEQLMDYAYKNGDLLGNYYTVFELSKNIHELRSDKDHLKISVEGDNYIITDITINENLMTYYGLKATTPEEVINIVVCYKNHKLEGYESKL